jgi:hypothetical protein
MENVACCRLVGLKLASERVSVVGMCWRYVACTAVQTRDLERKFGVFLHAVGYTWYIYMTLEWLYANCYSSLGCVYIYIYIYIYTSVRIIHDIEQQIGNKFLLTELKIPDQSLYSSEKLTESQQELAIFVKHLSAVHMRIKTLLNANNITAQA